MAVKPIGTWEGDWLSSIMNNGNLVDELGKRNGGPDTEELTRPSTRGACSTHNGGFG